jgi:hypothetical protein
MNSRLAAAAALMTFLIASGCASTDGADTKQTTAAPELVYRTGSNIPVRDKTPLTKEEKEKRAEDSRRVLQQMQTTDIGNPKAN